MATTKNGTYYPSNYDEVADVPMDMKKMAESIDNQLDSKVDKVEGKGLSTNDFTNGDKEKLDGLSNYDDSEIKQDIADLQEVNTSQDELIAKLKDNMFNLTAEGTSINVQDASDLPAVLEVSGGVRQNGEPTPDSPVEVEAVGDNVNLFDKDNADKKNIYINYSTKKIITSGNATSIILKCLPNKTYTISRTKILASDFVVGVSNEYPENNTTLTSNVNGNGKLKVSITTSDSDNYLIVYCRWGNIEYTIDEILNTIKIEEGSVVTSYSPYGQGSLEINKVNKNWFDLTKLEPDNNNGLESYSIENSNKILLKNKTSSQGSYFTYAFQAFKLDLKNGKYVLQLKVNTNSSNYRVLIRGKKESTNDIITTIDQSSSKEKTFEINYDEYLSYNIEFYANQSYIESQAITIYLDIQIELEEEATDYTPHQSEVYNLPIQQPMLSGDTFVKEDGNWFEVHGWEKYVITGNESWTQLNNIEGWYEAFCAEITGETNSGGSVVANIKSNMFLAKSLDDMFVQKISGIGARANGNIVIAFDSSYGITSINSFKAKLQELYNAGTPVEIWYKLTTPTKLPCTSEQIEVLEQLYNMPTYRPVTNIFTQEDLANLKLNYVADSKIYVDNKINDLTNQVNTINELLSATETSSILLSNLQKDLESEVM